nr:transposase [Chitinimonas sp. BJB300]
MLMTNLLDAERFPAADFGALYHRRWRIEEAFKRLKHHLWLESRYPA